MATSPPLMSPSKKPRPDYEELGRNWLDIPHDIMFSIFKKLGTLETLTIAQFVCTQWRSISKDPLMWRTVELHRSGDCAKLTVKQFENLCRHVIDRSSGQLVDISLQHLGTYEMLAYIVGSGCHLRRLRLKCCILLTDNGWSEVAKKLSWLEELEISYSFVYKDALEAFGQCCPLLKSLKLNMNVSEPYALIKNDDAFAIAKAMPALRHLELIGNELSEDGLVAILDGCPHLQSLDLRRCFNVAFRGNLQRRCADQIKNLSYSYDSADDNPFGRVNYFDELLFPMLSYMGWVD